MARKAYGIGILPAVIGVGAMLFALKAGGLAFTASAAQTEPAPVAVPTEDPLGNNPAADIQAALPNPVVDPAAAPEAFRPDVFAPEMAGAGITPAQMDVLTSLSDRRDLLERRQRDLDLQANVLAATEQRLDEKIVELKSLQARIEQLLDQREAQDAAQMESLVRVYSAMKPRDAARIFERLDNDVLLSVASRMNPEVMAGILASLTPEVAQRVTVELANRYSVPLPTEIPAIAPTAAPQAAPAAPVAAANPPIVPPAPAEPAAPAPEAPGPQAATTPVEPVPTEPAAVALDMATPGG